MSIVLKRYNLARDLHVKDIYSGSRKCYVKKSSVQDSTNYASNKDVIGPADPVSNLRLVIFAKPANETSLEKRYRKAREDTQEWNQAFWAKHNTNFTQERKKFQETLKAEGKMATADDMSVFYKKFLDRNWQTHFHYNIEWYKKNIKLLFYELRVKLAKFKLT